MKSRTITNLSLLLIALYMSAEFYAPYFREPATGYGYLPQSCQVFAAKKQCDLARGVLGPCSWARVVGLTYVYWLKTPQGHALLAYDLNGRIYVYDVNVGSYELKVPRGSHDLKTIAQGLHRRDKHVAFVRFLD